MLRIEGAPGVVDLTLFGLREVCDTSRSSLFEYPRSTTVPMGTPALSRVTGRPRGAEPGSRLGAVAAEHAPRPEDATRAMSAARRREGSCD